MFKYWKKVVFENYANFDGRARREEFFSFMLIHWFIWFLIYILIPPINLYNSEEFRPFCMVSSLIFMIPYWAIISRRFHDIGKMGLNWLFVFLPVIGWIWLLVLFCTEGDKGANKYGEDPKRLEE